MEGIHAVNIGNESPLVELFNYACSTTGVVFLSMSLCSVLRFDQTTMWYMVQMSQLICLRAHVQAYKRGVRRVALAGPGEVLLGILGVLLIRVLFGLDWLYSAAGMGARDASSIDAIQFATTRTHSPAHCARFDRLDDGPQVDSVHLLRLVVVLARSDLVVAVRKVSTPLWCQQRLVYPC